MALFEVIVPSYGYWKEQVKCQDACPVHTDARGYIRAIAAGEYELAYLIARGPNPLASICGRVCGAPCEESCRRGDLDKPLSIRALKRFVCERFGAESGLAREGGLVEYLREAARRYGPRDCQDTEELLPLLQGLLSGEIELVEGLSVGVIGSGPAGLAAAHDLALLGFRVTIYEAEPVLAGMLSTGIPAYRLPRELIQLEIEAILALGVQAELRCEVGRDISFPELRSRHDAVLIAVGARRSRQLDIPGVSGPGVLGGVEYLRRVSLGDPPPLGPRVVVIGGGNVAYDVGRTVLRQTSLDAARSAIRAAGVGSVFLCSLESLEEMPADDVEILEGDEEGIVRRNSLGPRRIVRGDDGRVEGVEFVRCVRVYDEQGRFDPRFDESVREVIPCDQVLLAIGQSVDLAFIDPERDGLAVSERGYLVCDPVTGRTGADDVFVIGDLAYGPKLLIHAVASGKRGARSVYEALTGRSLGHRPVELHLALPRYTREVGYERQGRLPVPVSSVEERLRAPDAPVELGYGEAEARCEAGRCLDCGVNTLFDGTRCVLCGGCVGGWWPSCAL